MYGAKWIPAEMVGNIFKPLYILFSRKYFLDELYENVIVKKVLIDGIFRAFAFFDSRVVDGAVNGIAGSTVAASKALRQMQAGSYRYMP